MTKQKENHLSSLLSRRNFSRILGGGVAISAVAPVFANAENTGNADSIVNSKINTALPAKAEEKIFCYVGCYTKECPKGVEGNGAGIYLFEMNPITGSLSLKTVFMGIASPSFLILSPKNDYLFAISEIDNYGVGKTGCVTSYSVDQKTGLLTKINTVSSGGAVPCHLSMHPSGKYLLIANYVGGCVSVVPVNNGFLSKPTHVVHPTGPRRPERAMDNPPGNYAISDHSGSHPHMISTSPSGKWVVVDDAGLDRIYFWRLDEKRGKLLPAPVPFLDLEPGAAPRHFVFNNEGTMLYNLCEQDSKVTVFQFDDKEGRAVAIQTVSTLSSEFHGSTLAAEIVMAPSGGFIYVSNRLGNSIAVFSVGADGTLTLQDEIWSHADYGRAMMLDPTATFLFSANQRSDSITSFRTNQKSGDIVFTHNFTPVGSPTVLAFMKGKS
ncbi:lactonase family protein [Acetobacteraceae bacterium]|nr:lactonase family protein [Acetobacteraceae bacterium]